MGIRRGSGRPPEYRTTAGQRVPGVTTIISRWGDKEGLLVWANRLGREGKDHRDERDKAAGAGHVAHAMIEADVHGVPWVPPTPEDRGLDPRDPKTADRYNEAVSKAKHCFAEYLEWKQSTRIEIVATEVPLVSDEHRFGGTIDAIASVNGRICLLDWKTSNAVHSTYLVQVAAYSRLWEEHNPLDRIERLHLLRVAKEADSFSHHSWGPETLDKGWRMFSLLREAYELDYALRKAAA